MLIIKRISHLSVCRVCVKYDDAEVTISSELHHLGVKLLVSYLTFFDFICLITDVMFPSRRDSRHKQTYF